MQIKNAQCINMQNAKNWDSRDTTYLVRWRPRLFQSSTVCKSLLVLNAKDDLRVDGQSFCFLASGIQRETPFSFLCFGLLSFFWFSTPSSPLFCRFYLQKGWSKDRKSVPASSLFLLSFFFIFSFLFFLFYCMPSWSHSNARMKEETPSVLCIFPACLWLFFLLFSLRFSLLFMLFLSAFFTPFSRSLEELIYSLTYLYLGKI